jgi:hypothetical protein
MLLVLKIRFKGILKCKNKLRKYHAYISTFLCSQCRFTKMIIFAPSRNKTKFVVKIKFFTSHFLISFTDDIKNVDF